MDLTPATNIGGAVLIRTGTKLSQIVLDRHGLLNLGDLAGWPLASTHLDVMADRFTHQLTPAAMLLLGQAIYFSQKIVRK
jgi:hypothetical protein